MKKISHCFKLSAIIHSKICIVIQHKQRDLYKVNQSHLPNLDKCQNISVSINLHVCSYFSTNTKFLEGRTFGSLIYTSKKIGTVLKYEILYL